MMSSAGHGGVFVPKGALTPECLAIDDAKAGFRGTYHRGEGMTLFKTTPPPPYSADILLASGSCFHFSASPPSDVASTAKLTGNDEDAAICAVLARVQQGQFQHADQLTRIMREHDWAWVWGHCGVLLAFTVPASSLLRLVDSFADQIDQQVGSTIGWIVEILAESTLLATVPTIVELHRKMTPSDRERYCGVVQRLSFMLEDHRGKIADGPGDMLLNPGYDELWEDPEWGSDFPPYETMLLDRAAELARSYPGRQAFLFGKPLSLVDLAEFTLLKVQRRRDCELVATARMLLEAYTGRNLTGFYTRGPKGSRLDQVAAAAMLEQLLESGELERYEPGVRYFFGRRIPE